MRFGRALKGYTFKEFTEVLNGLGFFEHQRNSTPRNLYRLRVALRDSTIKKKKGDKSYDDYGYITKNKE